MVNLLYGAVFALELALFVVFMVRIVASLRDKDTMALIARMFKTKQQRGPLTEDEQRMQEIFAKWFKRRNRSV